MCNDLELEMHSGWFFDGYWCLLSGCIASLHGTDKLYPFSQFVLSISCFSLILKSVQGRLFARWVLGKAGEVSLVLLSHLTSYIRCKGNTKKQNKKTRLPDPLVDHSSLRPDQQAGRLRPKPILSPALFEHEAVHRGLVPVLLQRRRDPLPRLQGEELDLVALRAYINVWLVK